MVAWYVNQIVPQLALKTCSPLTAAPVRGGTVTSTCTPLPPPVRYQSAPPNRIATPRPVSTQVRVLPPPDPAACPALPALRRFLETGIIWTFR